VYTYKCRQYEYRDNTKMSSCYTNVNSELTRAVVVCDVSEVVGFTSVTLASTVCVAGHTVISTCCYAQNTAISQVALGPASYG